MDRLNLNQTHVEELRSEQQSLKPLLSKPVPASALKLDDDVQWLISDFAMRVVWGHDDPDMFVAYCPDVFGEAGISVEGIYVIDRAPADPQETPMPIYPQQQYAQQPGIRAHLTQRQQKALRHLLRQLDHEHQQKVRELVRQKRPELLDEHEPHK